MKSAPSPALGAEKLTKEELVLHVAQMNAEIMDLRAKLHESVCEADWITDAMKARTRLLNERMKELDCVYAACRLFRDPDLRWDQRIGNIVDLLPKAWQFPEVACARAVIAGREFRTHGFRSGPWKMDEPVFAAGSPVGTVEVVYLQQELPEEDDGPFLREERQLLRVIAELLGGIASSDKARH